MSGLDNARQLMDSWVMAGLLAVTSVTTTMGAFGTMVLDRSRKISKDFYSSPVSRKSLAGGYILSSFIIGLVMSLLNLVLAELYIVAKGGSLLSAAALIKVLGLLVLSGLSNTSLMFFITSFFASENAFSTASTLIGTLIGFLTGVYLPIGMLPAPVQWGVKLFPPSHAAVLLRRAMMPSPISQGTVLPSEYAASLHKHLGSVFFFGGKALSGLGSMLFLIAAAALFFILAVFNISRKARQ
jgi:multidrug/hemolysin transport system permease protein